MSNPSDVVPVNLSDTRYDVIVRPGLLRDAGGVLASLTTSKKIAIVTDSHVDALHLPTLKTSLELAGFGIDVVRIPAGETHKTLADLGHIYDQLLKNRIDRKTLIIALGGGVIGDMTGFAAATILRGVPFVQVPTTLLSMVDASVGGKTGINHAEGKNLIGAFHHPKAVLIDPETLMTLPAAELHSGLAECIKHDIIRDSAGFDDLEKNIHKALSLDIDYLTKLIAHNVAIKAKVVEEDPTEQNVRAHLNFGHTFGHAIETATHYAYSHGQCVALGMTAAAHLAAKRQLISEKDRLRIVLLIEQANLPTKNNKFDMPATMHAMTSDKKVKDGKLRFVLPDRIGNVNIYEDVTTMEVEESLQSLRI